MNEQSAPSRCPSCRSLLADDYNDRADLLSGGARAAMRDAATVATNVATDAPAGSAPARGEWPIRRAAD